MKYKYENKILYFYFYGDFDCLNIDAIKGQVIELIAQNEIEKVIFDCKEISFVDSTGIGFVLARYKQCAQKKAELIMCNLSSENRIIFEMSGIFQIIKLQDNEVKL